MENNMKKIGFIIPIHEINKQNTDLLEKSIDSINNQSNVDEKINVYVVFPKKIKDKFQKFNKEWANINIINIVNSGDYSYQSQVNTAIDEISEDYFTVIEFDDEIDKTFLKNANKFITAYKDVNIFLPLIVDVNEKNEFIGFYNERAWHRQLIEDGESGIITKKLLEENSVFNLSGAIFKKQTFIDLGKYKTHIKLTFMYEFLLRAVHNNEKIMVIPKLLYKHWYGREGGLINFYSHHMPMNERKFWFDTALNEYLFKKDREIDLTPLKDNNNDTKKGE